MLQVALHTETSSYVKIYTRSRLISQKTAYRHVFLQLTSLTVLRVWRNNLFGHGFACQSCVFRRICKL